MSKFERVYLILCSIFAVVLVSSNMVYQKFISLNLFNYSLELSAGALLYPLTYIILDLIAEFYGKARANFCVKLALSITLLMGLVVYGIDLLPATQWSHVNNQTFHQVFGYFGIGFAASLIACYLSQQIDIFIYLKIKQLTQDKWPWVRNNISMAIALFVDTAIVISILVFFNVLPFDKLFTLILSSYSFKFLFTLLNAPFYSLFIKYLKKHLAENTNTSLILNQEKAL